MRAQTYGFLLAVVIVSIPAMADPISIGPNGIDSSGLTLAGGGALNGSGVLLGQVEVGRPSANPPDAAGNVHPNMPLINVFLQNGAAVANTNLDDHAENVAGVMVSTGAGTIGVSTGATLTSSAYNVPVGNGQPQAVLSAQHVISRGNSAINYSFGEAPALAGLEQLDGNSLISRGLDYLSFNSNTLNVVAGNEGTRFPLPTDHYNGLTVGYTQQTGGVFRQLNPGNTFDEDAVGARRSIDLVAPGTNIAMPSIDANGDGTFGDTGTDNSSGTSFAAPHVTGTVALLQQYGEDRIANSAPNFDPDLRRHQVTKAVLMNSADKVAGILGMQKTILDTGEVASGGERFHDVGADGVAGTADAGEGDGMFTAGEPFSDSNNNGAFDSGAGFYDANGNGAQDGGGNNWLASDAATSKFIPLDDQLGTGQLNARRALTQFAPGEHDSFGTADVPLIGWDWGVTDTAGSVHKYVLDEPLLKNSYVSITMAWDREIGLNDFGADGTAGTSDPGEGDGIFNVGESFTSLGLTDMDLYLMPKGADDLGDHIWASLSSVDSLEHIFFQIPDEGEYEFWVRQADAPLGDQGYGVAWWAVAAPEPHTLLMALLGVATILVTRRRSIVFSE